MKDAQNSDRSRPYSEYGTRLKEAAKLFDYSRAQISELLGYSEAHISRFNQGYLRLNDEQYEVLSQAWGCRSEYLKCLDNYPTEAHKEMDKNKISSLRRSIRTRYLDSIGIDIDTIEPDPAARCCLEEIIDATAVSIAETWARNSNR